MPSLGASVNWPGIVKGSYIVGLSVALRGNLHNYLSLSSLLRVLSVLTHTGRLQRQQDMFSQPCTVHALVDLIECVYYSPTLTEYVAAMI